jgi:type I restriction enzyme S subunit
MWEKNTLDVLIKTYGGKIQTGPFGSQLHQHDYKTEGIPVVMPKDINGDRIDTSSIARINEDDADRLGKHKLKIGDLVLPRRGDINKRAICKPENEGWLCGTGCLKIRLNDNVIDPDYLYYYFTLSPVVESILNKAVGSTMLNLSTSILSSTELVYPPLPTQRRIASILSAYDDLIENNLKRIKLLEKKAFLRYKTIVNSEIVEEKKLNQVTQFLKRGISPKYVNEDGVIVLNQKCIRNHIVSFEDSRLTDSEKNIPEERMLKKLDTLINSTGTGTLGRIAMNIQDEFPITVDSHITIVRANHEITPIYLCMSLFAMENVIEMMGEGATNQTELSPKKSWRRN